MWGADGNMDLKRHRFDATLLNEVPVCFGHPVGIEKCIIVTIREQFSRFRFVYLSINGHVIT